ncbi:hypothetical protein JCM5353_002851 [Sporobolomyces roseus]
MPSLAHTLGGAALLFAVATNAAGHVDNKPIHLRSERSNLRKRVAQPSSVDSQTSTNLLATASLPPPRQDSIYASPDFKSEKTTQRINQLLQTNVQAATEAIKLGKNDPTVNVDAGMTKRAKPGPNWRWDFNGSTPIRGVNLGGWLVTEPWITPSLFVNTGDETIVDEYTFCEKLGAKEAKKRLKAHWDSFYTEADIAEIASYGLNHVRIPIGYWAFDQVSRPGEPYVSGQYPYLLKAIGWARKHGIKVMVDLHGAPQSQNGFDNSGRRGAAQWQTSQENVERTLDVVGILSKEFAKPKYADTVTILQALNEPAGFISQQVIDVYRQFAYDSYGRVRYPTGNNPSDVYLSLHDAFQPLKTTAGVWEKSFPSPEFLGVSYSDHPYFVFNEADLKKNDEQRVATICGMKDYYARANSFNPVLLDEFTAAITDCTNFLNGRGIGARYDGTYPGSSYTGSCEGKTGKASTFSQEYKTSLAKSWSAQVETFESAASGWAENSDDWTYSAGVKGGWIPKDPNKPIYPNICA